MLKKNNHDLELCTVIKRPLLKTDTRRKRQYAIALIGVRVQFKIRCTFDLAWTSQVTVTSFLQEMDEKTIQSRSDCEYRSHTDLPAVSLLKQCSYIRMVVVLNASLAV